MISDFIKKKYVLNNIWKIKRVANTIENFEYETRYKII